MDGGMKRALLCFPPGWSLCTGAPHLALPLLKAALAAASFDARCIDLNWYAGQAHGVFPGPPELDAAIAVGGLEHLNTPYFTLEDSLQAAAAPHGGDWNAQLGFSYADCPERSSTQALEACGRGSPYQVAFDVFLRTLADEQPDLVGFSIAATQQLVPTLQLCSLMRAAGFEGAVVLGGNTVSRLAAELAPSRVWDVVDFLITFQGEGPLVALCRALRDSSDLEAVPNLIRREGRHVRTSASAAAMSPNRLPCPDYDDLPVGSYAGRNFLNIVAARGCYYGKCSFCAIPYGWGDGGYGGARSAQLVVEDMKRLAARYGLIRFKFVDEALSPSFMRALSRLILAESLPFEWEGYTRLELAWMDPDFVRLVSSAGFRKGYFGLEVLGSAARDALNKRDPADPDRLLRLCADNDVRAHLFCMYGYPGTSEDDARRTTDYVLENAGRIDTADIFPWTLAKHTSAPGVAPVADPDEDWRLEFEHLAVEPGVLSSSEIRRIAASCEDLVWNSAPRLLHPTYRMVSPWGADRVAASTPRSADLQSQYAAQVNQML